MAGTAENLIRFLDRWQSRRIVVAGDFMLDRYYYGNAQRLSPDAPVPILSIEREEHKPGGAANVCLDLLALGCAVHCLGVAGEDSDGKTLRAELATAGCQVAGIIAAGDGRPTTVKSNFVGLAQHRHPQKMFRVDQETRAPIGPQATAQLLEVARQVLPGAAALCLEDYNKGVISPDLAQQLIALARSLNVPVLVDPAAIEDYSKYRGSSCITPNRTEAALATGIEGETEEELRQIARKLLKQLDLEAVVLTLDKQGAMLLEKGGKAVMVPTVARHVYDVTGAGDMVLAALAAARANGADWLAAVELANTAAGLEVERFGTVPIALHEILLALLSQQHAPHEKLRTLDLLLPELSAYRKQGKKIVFTNGCFDILHAGHVNFLRQARQQGDLLVVGVNSDDSIRRLKGPQRPVNHLDDRVMVLSELQSVDYVIVFDQDTPVHLLKAIAPDVLVKGGDYTRSQVVGGDLVEQQGGKVVLVDLVDGRSTTNIIEKLSTAPR